jgi:predicted O-methyltransferase YrrM
MTTITIPEKIRSLGESDADSRWADLRELARLTALKARPDGSAYEGNWWRGPLLYSLIAHGRPKNVVEVGTGRGYGALCMGQAAVDHQLDCTIWSIDQLSTDAVQDWLLDPGDGPRVERLSLREVWDRWAPAAAVDRVRLLTGDSGSVLNDWSVTERGRVDFCFIDGGHDYWTVKNDFISILRIASPTLNVLFDDYTDRPGYGVKRLLERDIAKRGPSIAVEVLDTTIEDESPLGSYRHGMAHLHAAELGHDPVGRFFSPVQVGGFRLARTVDRSVEAGRNRLGSILRR